jgi:signal transduction histidine kinase
MPLASPDGGVQVRKFFAQPSEPAHIVQFYDSDAFLCDNLAQFIGTGIATGEPTLVIATAAHRAGFRERLERNAIDVNAAAAKGLYVELDASATLATFMSGSVPDAARFFDQVGAVVAATQAARPGSPVRAYGEMVDLLWRAGNRDGAIRLEELWNTLGQRAPFALLCAYSMDNFTDAADGAAFASICHLHSHVIPSEGYSALDTADGRLREVTLLQQRAVALEREMVRRAELEAELREALGRETAARSAAERTIHFNELFVGMLGHDLRNPLNAILTTAQYIARSTEETKTTAAATRIATSSLRMARMIEQLLDFTKLRLGDGLVPNRTFANLMELCERTSTELLSAHPGCDIVVASAGDPRGGVDADQLLQVLSNVMGNAVQHGAPGSTVEVRCDGTDPASLVLMVHNAGVVAPEVLPVLFEPFRADTKGRYTRGLGLGLYISRQIIEAHGGTIDVRSTEADGTAFTIRLPRNGGCSPS